MWMVRICQLKNIDFQSGHKSQGKLYGVYKKLALNVKVQRDEMWNDDELCHDNTNQKKVGWLY